MVSSFGVINVDLVFHYIKKQSQIRFVRVIPIGYNYLKILLPSAWMTKFVSEKSRIKKIECSEMKHKGTDGSGTHPRAWFSAWSFWSRRLWLKPVFCWAEYKNFRMISTFEPGNAKIDFFLQILGMMLDYCLLCMKLITDIIIWELDQKTGGTPSFKQLP